MGRNFSLSIKSSNGQLRNITAEDEELLSNNSEEILKTQEDIL